MWRFARRHPCLPHLERNPHLFEGREGGGGGSTLAIALTALAIALFVTRHLLAGNKDVGSIGLTQTATTSSMSCRRHGPIWPKLEQHVMSCRHAATCRDMLATFPAKYSTPPPPPKKIDQNLLTITKLPRHPPAVSAPAPAYAH